MTRAHFEPELTSEELWAEAQRMRRLRRKRAQEELRLMRMAQGNALVLDIEAGTYFTMPGDVARTKLEPWDPASPTPSID
jgi:hypothetical protein